MNSMPDEAWGSSRAEVAAARALEKRPRPLVPNAQAQMEPGSPSMDLWKQTRWLLL
jgi:hypothetical protein